MRESARILCYVEDTIMKNVINRYHVSKQDLFVINIYEFIDLFMDILQHSGVVQKIAKLIHTIIYQWQ